MKFRISISIKLKIKKYLISFIIIIFNNIHKKKLMEYKIKNIYQIQNHAYK